MQIPNYAFLLCVTITLLCGCGSTTQPAQGTFTKADSLTDHYLSLQDSVHQLWNIMTNEENQKIEALHHLLHELSVSNPADMQNLSSLQERLNQLIRMRYTQKTMHNPDVVTEYDLASQVLTDDLMATALAKKEYYYNKTLQKLVNTIEEAQTRAGACRMQYDTIVSIYNNFIEKNEGSLRQTDESLSLEKKARFRVISNH